MLSRDAILATPASKEAPKGPIPRPFPVFPAAAAIACWVGSYFARPVTVWTDWLRGSAVALAVITLVIWSAPRIITGGKLRLPFNLESIGAVVLFLRFWQPADNFTPSWGLAPLDDAGASTRPVASSAAASISNRCAPKLPFRFARG